VALYFGARPNFEGSEAVLITGTIFGGAGLYFNILFTCRILILLFDYFVGCLTTVYQLRHYSAPKQMKW
jgi:hypothetical protein